MSSVNKVILVGNLGQDPELKGEKFCTFSVATSERWKDKTTGERKERTEWHNCSCGMPGLVGVIMQYLSKGQKVYLEGSLRTRKVEGEGGTRYYTGINVTNLTMLSPKGTAPESSDQYGQGNGVNQAAVEELDDQVPF